MLEIKELYQNYFYGTNALNGISFVLKDGEKLAVIAKNGGGKTSLLKCITGLFPASSGNIILDGKDITNLKIKDRGVRMVYDDGGLIKQRSVFFNLSYPLKLRKLSRKDRFIKAYQVAKDYDLEPFFKEQAFRLFTPEIIALALARLELRDSSLTLIDDVFSIANGLERRDLFDKFLPKLRALSGNVIFTTDSLEEAISFGDKVLVLNNGYQDQFGSFEELRTDPQTLLVDKLFNPYRNRKILDVVDGVATFNNIKFKLPSDYNSTEVFVSFELINDNNGEDFIIGNRKYVGEDTFAYYNNEDLVYVSTMNEKDFKVSANISTLKLYDRVTEKLLTFEVI